MEGRQVSRQLWISALALAAIDLGACFDDGYKYMKLELPLEQMSVAEKLQAMEALWADLSRNAPDEVIPSWHAEVLAARERRLAAVQERVLDWDEAKRQLRLEIDEGQNS